MRLCIRSAGMFALEKLSGISEWQRHNARAVADIAGRYGNGRR